MENEIEFEFTTRMWENRIKGQPVGENVYIAIDRTSAELTKKECLVLGEWLIEKSK